MSLANLYTELHRAYIVWRNMLKRVNVSDLIDVSLIVAVLLSTALWCWIGTR